ncbi:MAG: PqqD family protein [Prevotella sp.]|nr:PqqD family protein [Prevotella sp.]
MKVYALKYNLHFQKLGEEYIGVAVGEDSLRFGEMLRLNESAVCVAELLREPHTIAEISQRLYHDYDETIETLNVIVEGMMREYVKEGWIDEQEK